MASISSPGIGSGLDVNTLVNQLVAAERAPGDARFNKVESETRAELSAFGALKSALSGLESTLKKFEGTASAMGRKAVVGSDAGFTASALATAAPGSYQVKVERLAQAHKLQSAPIAATTQVGHGTLSIAVGSGTPIEVAIAEGGGTLAQIRDAINAKAGGVGVTASVVRGDAGDVLLLSATTAGSAGALTVTQSGGDGGLAALTTGGGLSVQAAAQDAVVVVDGITRTATGNRITDVIDGVTLDLTKADTTKTFSLDISADASTLKASVLGMISAYNTALNAIRTQSAYNATTKVGAALSGDAAPRAMQTSLRNAIGNASAELAALGIKGSKDGTLSLDAAKFDATVAADPNAVAKVLGDAGALGTQMRGIVSGYVATGGVLEGRTTAANQKLTRLTRDRDAFETRIASIESTYRKQFTALDSLMAKMSGTSSYLSQQLASLSKS